MTTVTAMLTPTPADHDVTATTLAEVYARDATNTAVLVLDGHGLRLSVERGHLLLHDGIGVHRRSRWLSRAQRTVRRIVVLGHTGHLTLEAIRWCAEVGIALVQLDTHGALLVVAGAKDHDDPRLRRAQALAPDNPTGLVITRALLAAKVTGQAAVCNENLHLPAARDHLTALADQLAQAPTVSACRDTEATAANAYFGAWAGRVAVRFASRDTGRVPKHWHAFTARRSPLLTGKSPRKAADPVNALLNYGYALGEIECTLALRAVGLDPGLGIVQHRPQAPRQPGAGPPRSAPPSHRRARAGAAEPAAPASQRPTRDRRRHLPAARPTHPRARRRPAVLRPHRGPTRRSHCAHPRPSAPRSGTAADTTHQSQRPRRANPSQ